MKAILDSAASLEILYWFALGSLFFFAFGKCFSVWVLFLYALTTVKEEETLKGAKVLMPKVGQPLKIVFLQSEISEYHPLMGCIPMKAQARTFVSNVCQLSQWDGKVPNGL